MTDKKTALKTHDLFLQKIQNIIDVNEDDICKEGLTLLHNVALQHNYKSDRSINENVSLAFVAFGREADSIGLEKRYSYASQENAEQEQSIAVELVPA